MKMKAKNLLLCIFFVAILVISILEILPAPPLGQNPENNSKLSVNTAGLGLTEEYNETYHGYVHVSPEDSRYLVFDDGTPFYPIGINTGWWLDESQAQNMKNHNINLGRVWMCSWHINIEPTLGVYSESAAEDLDDILALAEEYDLYIQLVLLTFTDFAYEHGDHWRIDNPYNADNGGPCEDPIDFFTDETAKYYFKKRLNYILDRWGDNHRIAIWEFWNEVSLVGWGYPPQATDAIVKPWHEEMAQVFYENDTHQRPLTTSAHGDVFWDQTFLSDANDIIQIHTYATSNPITLASMVSSYIKRYENSGKPVVIGEYGVTSGDKVEFLHNGLWAALASGSGYSSMYWYTNHFEMSAAQWDRYLYFETFIRGIPWPSLNITEGTAALSGATNTDAYSIQDNSFALAWVLHKTSGTVSGAELSFSNLTNGYYNVSVYSDSTGTYLSNYEADVITSELTVNLPDFTTHLAVKLVGALSDTPYGPEAAFTYSPPNPRVNETVTFNASTSLPGWNITTQPIVNYTWDFGDGTNATTSNPIITHEYSSNDTHTVTLNVTDSQGLWNTTQRMLTVYPPYHDVAIINVIRSPGYCYSLCIDFAYPYWTSLGDIYPPPGRELVPYQFNVTAANLGGFTETFDVTAYFENATFRGAMGTQIVTNLVPGETRTLTFTWDLTDLPASTKGSEVRYTLWANITSTVENETYLGNNYLVDASVKMLWPGNTNRDNQISIADVGPIVFAWKSECGDPNWDCRCDYNRDGEIDTWDISVIIFQWGKMP